MTESTDITIGRRIQALRDGRGLLQSELAKRLSAAGLDWSQATLSKVERGERPVRFAEAPIIASVFGLDVVDLLPTASALNGALSKAVWTVSERERELWSAEHELVRAKNELALLRLLHDLTEEPLMRCKVSLSWARFMSDVFSDEHSISGFSAEDTLRHLGGTDDVISRLRADVDAAVEAWRTDGVLPEGIRDPGFPMDSAWAVRRQVSEVLYRRAFGKLFPNVDFEETDTNDADASSLSLLNQLPAVTVIRTDAR